MSMSNIVEIQSRDSWVKVVGMGVIAVLHAAYDDQRADAEGASTRRYRNENVFRSFTARASPRKFYILQ
jgi:hypothetical protein